MLWGLIDNDQGRSVNISVPAGSGRRSRPGISIHRCDLRRSDTTSRDGIPVTIVARTLLDLAPSLPRRSLERALDEAIYRKRATPSVLRRAVDRSRTARALRKALERHEPGTTRTETDLERDRERDVELRAGGYPPPLRFTYRHLTGKPGWVASNLRQALGV